MEGGMVLGGAHARRCQGTSVIWSPCKVLFVIPAVAHSPAPAAQLHAASSSVAAGTALLQLGVEEHLSEGLGGFLPSEGRMHCFCLQTLAAPGLLKKGKFTKNGVTLSPCKDAKV